MSNEELIRHAVEELFEKGNLELINKVFSKDYVAHAGNKTHHGHPFIKRWLDQLFSSIVNIKVDEILILSNDSRSVSWQRTLSGTHQNELRGIPASHKKVKWTELLVSRFENEKIVEEWIVSDLAAELMLNQPKHRSKE